MGSVCFSGASLPVVSRSPARQLPNPSLEAAGTIASALIDARAETVLLILPEHLRPPEDVIQSGDACWPVRKKVPRRSRAVQGKGH